MPGTGDVTTLTQLKMQTSLPGRQTVNLDIYPFRQYIYYYYYYYYEFSSGNRSMAILEDRQLDFGYTIHFKFSLLISVVVAQRI